PPAAVPHDPPGAVRLPPLTSYAMSPSHDGPGGNHMQKLTHALTAALLAVAAVAFAQPVADQAAALERGRELTRAFYAGELAPIAQALSAELEIGRASCREGEDASGGDGAAPA